eukprot:jgi/Bigna1/134872/aug1.27_g9580
MTNIGLLSAVFSSDCSRIKLGFSVSTALSPAFECAELLSGNSAQQLGTGYSCTWSDSRQVTIALGSSATVQPGSAISVRFRGLEGNATVGIPLDVIQTKVVLDGSDAVGTCDSITLDAGQSQGALGRDFTRISWSYIPGNLSTLSPAAKAYITNLQGMRMEIPSANASLGSHTFALTMTNWLNHTSTANFTVVKRSDFVPIILRPYAGQLRAKVQNTLSIRAQIVVPQCAGNSTGRSGVMTRGTWKQALPSSRNLGSAQIFASELSTEAVAIPERTSVYLRLAPYSLSVGSVYGFTLTATAVDVTSGIVLGTGNATFLVRVEADPVVAVISGGGRRSIPALELSQELVTFDASESWDPATAAGNDTQELQFQWRLSIPNSAFALTLPVGTLESGPQLNITSGFLYSLNLTSLIVQLNVTGRPSSANYSRISTAYQEISLSTFPIPILNLGVQGARVYEGDGSSGGGTQRLILNSGSRVALVTSTQHSSAITSYSWFCDSENFAPLIEGPAGGGGVEGLLSPRNVSNLVISPGTLASPASFIFTVQAHDKYGQTGSATISFSTNSPPSLGSCGGSPDLSSSSSSPSSVVAGSAVASPPFTTGVALSTSYVLFCQDWTDEDIPLTYGFQVEYANIPT